MTTDTGTIGPAAADAVAAPLDLLLTDAVFGALSRLNPGGSGLRLAAALAARPRLVAGRGRELLGEMARIAVGTSQVQPSRRDRRFADPGWAGNPLLRRVMQAYLAAAETAGGLAADADLDWADTQRVNFVLENLVDAMAPSNNPILNPAALKAAIDTGGGSIQVAKECPEGPQEWLRHAENCHGSWWPDYASWLAERCGQEVAAPGEQGGGGLEPHLAHQRPWHRAASDQLTAQELQIAQLAAQGLSNRDIAERLYLSHRDDRHAPVPHLPQARDHQPR
jgi:Poly-beta-hydroxybutyrate polymerase (PhaC) N-terminus/Bacterial regulatory proteins, luxR family